MAHYRITGGAPLNGEITVSGRKNAALKLIAASILTEGTVSLDRLPEILDVASMLEILRTLGAEVGRTSPSSCVIGAGSVSGTSIPAELGQRLRASLVLVGPLLARFGKAEFPHPGGDLIGKRSILPHLMAFERLGAKVDFDGETYRVTSDGLKGTEIYLPEATVTGTENLIMAACRAQGDTVIYNAAQEPHITNLCDLLRQLGYQISGDGTSTVRIAGSPALSVQDAHVEIIPDDIEVGTFAVAALVTKGDLTIRGTGDYRLVMPILAKLDEFNARYEYSSEAQTLRLLPSEELRAASIRPQPWPSFPTDLGSVFAVLATQAKGTTLIHEWMFEGRLTFLERMRTMGANVVLADAHRALITGPTKLKASAMVSPDIRAGAALLIAALIAKGESVIEHVEHVERGYARIDERLRSLGAQIIREED